MSQNSQMRELSDIGGIAGTIQTIRFNNFSPGKERKVPF